MGQLDDALIMYLMFLSEGVYSPHLIHRTVIHGSLPSLSPLPSPENIKTQLRHSSAESGSLS